MKNKKLTKFEIINIISFSHKNVNSKNSKNGDKFAVCGLVMSIDNSDK